MLYEIKCYMESTSYDKCWIQVEADSPEEALKKAKENPESCDFIDSKCVDISNNVFVDFDEWEITDARSS